MVLMYLSKRLRRAALSAIFGYVYIPRCTVCHRRYTLRGMDCSDIHIPILYYAYTPIGILPLNFQIPRFCG